MRRPRFVGFLVVIALLTAVSLRAQVEKNPGASLAFTFTKVDLELLRQTDALDKYIEERGWIYQDPAMDAYLEKLGTSLVPPQTLENVKWHFRVVRDLQANAFALPNGSVYVNSGLLARLENEAQLAGVLGHEITHVVNRHSYLLNRSTRKKAVAVDLMVGGARTLDYFGVSSLVVDAVTSALPTIIVSTIYGYSRELERESDTQAVRTLQARGYDLGEFARGMGLLRNGPEVELSDEAVFWSSHPKLDNRVRFITEQANSVQPRGNQLIVNQTAYGDAVSNVLRHNAELAIRLGCSRTAVATAQRLIAKDPTGAGNYVLLGDALRSLGARTPRPDPAEETSKGKNATRVRLQHMTPAEYDEALMADKHGPEHWQQNAAGAEAAFRKALEISPQNPGARRGLGFLYERMNRREEAAAEFQRYLDLAPDAKDVRQVKMHLDAVKQSAPVNTSKSDSSHVQ